MQLQPVSGLPEIQPGDDLATLVRERIDLDPDSILCLASTVVSKAEGRFANLTEFPAGPRAREIAAHLEEITDDEKDSRFAQAVLEESTELLMEAPFLLTETRFGHICVNAGIDRSNTGGEELLLLPKHPTESAARLSEALSVPVIVTDTCGRPFRHGQRGVALGWAGMPASRDWRGEKDRDGRELGVTVESVIDELAAAANLVAGEGAGGTPAVVVRHFEFGEMEGSNEHFRAVEDDYVRKALRGWSHERTK
jgi:coenzyme F420-0:L-glutamate ligase/coenzyme F420-1:gamma-L-glutamate ligase